MKQKYFDLIKFKNKNTALLKLLNYCNEKILVQKYAKEVMVTISEPLLMF